MNKLHENRLTYIKDDDIREWARNLVKEWSKNEATTACIIELAALYEQMIRFQKQIDEAPLIIPTANGMKTNPLLKHYEKARSQFSKLLKQIGVTPDAVINGENYE